MGEGQRNNQQGSFENRQTGFQFRGGHPDWMRPVKKAGWQQWLMPLYRRMALWRKWHRGQFPSLAGHDDHGGGLSVSVSPEDNRPNRRRGSDNLYWVASPTSKCGAAARWEKFLRTADQQELERVRQWVATIPDEKSRWLAFLLFAGRSSGSMCRVEMAALLGVSLAWLELQAGVLLEERLLLARGENNGCELSA